MECRKVIQKQLNECLILLSSLNAQQWISTREVADRLDISVYLARLRLLALANVGAVESQTRSGFQRGRGRTRYWRCR